jgi:hypothetical protein
MEKNRVKKAKTAARKSVGTARRRADTIGPGRQFIGKRDTAAKMAGVRRKKNPIKKRADIDGEDLVLYRATSISGLVTALVVLFTASGNWVSLQLPLVGSQTLSLSQVADYSGLMGGVAMYIDAGVGSGLQIVSLVAAVSVVVLYAGAIALIVLSVLTLLSRKEERCEIFCGIMGWVGTAIAIVGLVFVAAPIFVSVLGFMPIPLIVLVVAGISRFLGGLF